MQKGKKYQPLGVGMVESTTELGTFLRSRRLELGLSQTEVSERACMEQSNYSALERGEAGSRALSHHAAELASALACDPSELQAFMPASKEPQTDLGELISSRRQELGLDIADLARETGIRRNYLLRIETGTRDSISYATAWKLANALHLDISVFGKFLCVRRRDREDNEGAPSLGTTVRSRRKELGLSITDLAHLLGITRQMVSCIELGKVILENDALLIGLAHVLQMKPEALRSLRPKRRILSNKKHPIAPGTLAALVFDRRIALGLTQRAVEEKAGAPRNGVHCIEKGEAHLLKVDATFWSRLAAALECEIPAELIPARASRAQESPLVHTEDKNVSAPTPDMSAMIQDTATDRELPSDDFVRIRELSGMGHTEAERKGVRLLWRLLERQHQGLFLFFAKDGELVEWELIV